jgi:hypothetical protein
VTKTTNHFLAHERHRASNLHPQKLSAEAYATAKMRTYDDTFSGEKIYPGKVGTALIPRAEHVHCKHYLSGKRQNGGAEDRMD